MMYFIVLVCVTCYYLFIKPSGKEESDVMSEQNRRTKTCRGM